MSDRCDPDELCRLCRVDPCRCADITSDELVRDAIGHIAFYFENEKVTGARSINDLREAMENLKLVVSRGTIPCAECATLKDWQKRTEDSRDTWKDDYMKLETERNTLRAALDRVIHYTNNHGYSASTSVLQHGYNAIENIASVALRDTPKPSPPAPEQDDKPFGLDLVEPGPHTIEPVIGDPAQEQRSPWPLTGTDAEKLRQYMALTQKVMDADKKRIEEFEIRAEGCDCDDPT